MQQSEVRVSHNGPKGHKIDAVAYFTNSFLNIIIPKVERDHEMNLNVKVTKGKDGLLNFCFSGEEDYIECRMLTKEGFNTSKFPINN